MSRPLLADGFLPPFLVLRTALDATATGHRRLVSIFRLRNPPALSSCEFCICFPAPAEKREALKTELQRLKGEVPAGQKKAPSVSKPPGISASRGSICLQEIRLPLKADFVCATANKPGRVERGRIDSFGCGTSILFRSSPISISDSMKHSFFILIRAGAENTVATPLSSTHCGLSGDTLTFPTKFAL